MAIVYTEIPDNFSEIEKHVITDIDEIKKCFLSPGRIIFYDACSFQRHSCLSHFVRDYLISYIKSQRAVVFITRCILMELASAKHRLESRHIDFIKDLDRAGVSTFIFNEECIFDILQECFTTNRKINEYLTWAVRDIKSMVSTITETLNNDVNLYNALNNSKGYAKSNLYSWFFSAVRGNKEQGDNLGEELIIICLHILSHLPGPDGDGKLIFITDDKGAALSFGRSIQNTNSKHKGDEVALFSTPRLVQHMFRDNVYLSKEEMTEILSQGVNGNVTVMGLQGYQLTINPKISMSAEELAKNIIKPNGIVIIF